MRERFIFNLSRTCAVALLVACWAALACAESPHWIGAPQEGDRWRFEKRLTIEEAVLSARLKLAVDFCAAVVTINDQPAITVEPYSQTQEIDVTRFVRRGENRIGVAMSRIPGPAAFALSMDIAHPGGRLTSIVSDRSWKAKPTDIEPKAAEARLALDRGAVRPELWGLGRRPATISPWENYEQWRQALGDKGQRPPKFWTAAGFEIELVRSAAADEGSWIALAFDRQGRVTISREDQGLLRMTLADDRRSVARVEPIAVDLKECRGLIYDEDWLYANANNNKAMYRLKLTDDAKPADLQLLREFPGDVGHGRNDLAVGADGRIYSIHGDSVQPPGPPVVDRTSPLRQSRRDKPQKEAYVVRADREGKSWELLCTGLRNPYGLAFHPNWDLFTYDADNEFDMGTPWYRPTRVVQLVSGADYGYRQANGNWPPNFPDHPDNGLPTIDVGRGSPTAVMFGTKLNFPSPYREALYILDWAYGRVVAVHLAPRGAGYRAGLELFLEGKPLNVTDLAAGPDGAMWLITGGRKTQSALYRVTATNNSADKSTIAAESLHEREVEKFSQVQREFRRRIERHHEDQDVQAIDKVWPKLFAHDPIMRHAARIAIEQRRITKLQGTVTGFLKYDWLFRAMKPDVPESPQQISGAPLWAYLAAVRIGDPVAAGLVDRVLMVSPGELDLSAKFALVFLHRACLTHAAEIVALHRDAIVRQLVAIWPDPATEGLHVCPFGNNSELRRRLALLLADLGDPDIVARVAGTLLSSDVQEDRIQGLLALRNVRSGWTLETRQTYFAALRDASRFVGGQGMPTFLDRLRTDSLATLSDDERGKLADVLAPPKADDEPLPPTRPKVRAWSLEDLSPLVDDNSQGDAKRGAVIFRDALCSRCHRAGLAGPAVGPDLTFVARRFNRRDLLESILAPSRVVAENYCNVQVVTESGSVHIGRLVSEGDFRSETLRLNIDPLHPGKIVEIDKKDIAQQQLLETSPMPQGLLDTFTREEIADLLKFLTE